MLDIIKDESKGCFCSQGFFLWRSDPPRLLQRARLVCGRARRLGREYHIFLQDLISIHSSSDSCPSCAKIEQQLLKIGLNKEWAFILARCELPSRWLKIIVNERLSIRWNKQEYTIKSSVISLCLDNWCFQTPQKLSGEDKMTEKRVADWFFFPKQIVDFWPPPPHNGRTVAPEAILFESPCRAHSETKIAQIICQGRDFNHLFYYS